MKGLILKGSKQLVSSTAFFKSNFANSINLSSLLPWHLFFLDLSFESEDKKH